MESRFCPEMHAQHTDCVHTIMPMYTSRVLTRFLDLCHA